MAFRRQVGNLATILLQQHLRDKAAAEDDRRAAALRQELEDQRHANQTDENIQTAGLETAQQKQLAAIKDPTGEIAQRLGQFSLIPSQAQRQGPMMEEISKAKTPEDLMSKEGFRSKLAASPGGINSLPEFVSGLNAIDQKGQEIQDEQQAADARTAQQKYDESFQQGKAKSDQAAFSAPQDINTLNQTESGTRTEKGKTAYSQAANTGLATQRTADKFSEGDTYKDASGAWHWLKRSEDGSVNDTLLPPGYEPGGPGQAGDQRLTASQVDNLASLNTAETEGVKVLTTMKALGLDKSNDWLTPRADAFAIQTLKIAPQLWARADAVQRLNYVRGAVLRTMMGARPSQYIAEIYANHVPDQLQSGEQLYHTMHNVLEQVGARRTEIESLTNRKPGSLSPTSGMTYSQWIQQNGVDDPTGGTMGEQGDPDILNFMQRPKR